MKFHMTQTMLELVDAAIDKIDLEHEYVGIEKMGGYFVAMASSRLPSSVVVIATIAKQEAKFNVCMRVVDFLDDLDDSEWERPFTKVR